MGLCNGNEWMDNFRDYPGFDLGVGDEWMGLCNGNEWMDLIFTNGLRSRLH